MSEVIVVKVGTGVLTRVEDGRLDGGSVVRLVTALANQVRMGRKIVLVSSGAVGAGVSALGLDRYPTELPEKQAAAAVGQARLMHTYENLFSHFDLSVGQILITGNNLKRDKIRQRVFDTMGCLLAKGDVVPIVNQNDSVAVEEISKGDNDMLSVRVAGLLEARLLVLLTSTDGLCDGMNGPLVEQVRDMEKARDMAGQVSGRFSIGGMLSKLNAVEKGIANGTEVVIANGRKPERLNDIVEGRGICTRFLVENLQDDDE